MLFGGIWLLVLPANSFPTAGLTSASALMTASALAPPADSTYNF